MEEENIQNIDMDSLIASLRFPLSSLIERACVRLLPFFYEQVEACRRKKGFLGHNATAEND